MREDSREAKMADDVDRMDGPSAPGTRASSAAEGWKSDGTSKSTARIDTGCQDRETMPLNSRRLTDPLLRQLAGGLGVPVTAPHADLRPLIKGKRSCSVTHPSHCK